MTNMHVVLSTSAKDGIERLACFYLKRRPCRHIREKKSTYL